MKKSSKKNGCPFKIKNYVCGPSSEYGYEGIPQFDRCSLRVDAWRPDCDCIGEDRCPILKK